MSRTAAERATTALSKAVNSLPPASETCQAFGRAYCGRLATCDAQQFRSEFGDAARCIERWAAFCTRTQALTGSGFTDAEVKQCGTVLDTWSCARFRPLADIMIPACHPQGAKATGARCLDDRQCKTGYCLQLWPASPGCGECAARAKSNGKCWNGVPESPKLGCQLGEVCSRGFCLGPMKDEGEACGAAGAWTSDCYGDEPTGRWLGCAGPAPRADALGVCRRYESPATCSTDADCESNDFCAAAKCKAPSWRTLGASCAEPHQSCLGGDCVDGRCRAAASAGDACNEDVSCSFPFVCVDGACRLTNPRCE